MSEKVNISVKVEGEDEGKDAKGDKYLLLVIDDGAPLVRTNISDRAELLFRVTEIITTLLGVGKPSEETVQRMAEIEAQNQLLVVAVGKLQEQVKALFPTPPPDLPQDLST